MVQYKWFKSSLQIHLFHVVDHAKDRLALKGFIRVQNHLNALIFDKCIQASLNN